MKFLYFTDLHFCSTAPGRRTEEYPVRLLQKLEHVRALGKDLGVDAFLQGGDIYSRKRVSFAELNSLMVTFQSFPAPVYGIAGNHDLVGHQSQSYGNTAYGALCTSGALRHLGVLPMSFKEVEVLGRSYMPDYESTDPFSAEGIDKPTIILTHGMLLEKPVPFELKHVLIKDVEVPDNVLILNGHNHSQFNRGNVWNCGSLSRVTIDQQEFKPRVLEIEWDDGWKVTPHEVPVEAGVWTEASVAPQKSDSDSIDSFVSTLESEVGDIQMSNEALLERCLEGKSDKVRELVLSLIEESR